MKLLEAAGAAFPGKSPRILWRRLRMLGAARRYKANLRPLLEAPASSSAALLLAERPQMLGSLLWPYQNAAWDADQRLDRIAAHCAALDTLGAPFVFSSQDRLVLADLDHVMPQMRVVLDQPKWFMREGGLTLNIFVGSFRAYSIAFSFFQDTAINTGINTGTQPRSIFIGAVQGRNTDGALQLYRDLTKALHGMRPRDFLLEVLRMIAAATHSTQLYAVSDAARHHRHAYFKGAASGQDYDAIWADRGGQKVDDTMFRLPITAHHRPLADIKAKKRSLYRQRYAFLDALQVEIQAALPTLQPVQFPDS